MAGRRGLLKRKPNFTRQEIDILTSEVLKYEQLLFGAAAANVNAYEKQKIWWRITSKINAAGRNQRDIGEVKNRWRGLRRRAKDQIARHRLQRHARPPAPRPAAPHLKGGGGGSEPPSQPELGPEWCPHGVCPLGKPPPGAIEVAALPGVKEEPVNEEPVDVKPEPASPLPIEAIQQRVSWGGERRLLRSSGQIPDEPYEDWSRSSPNSSQTELSLSELGGQQEALVSDYARITFDQESPHGPLDNCHMGDATPPLTVPIQEGLSENSHLSLAERRIVQANEQLVQEVRAFRKEYAESHRETASILHSIAEALNGVHSSLSEIRDLYLCQQVVPKQ